MYDTQREFQAALWCCAYEEQHYPTSQPIVTTQESDHVAND